MFRIIECKIYLINIIKMPSRYTSTNKHTCVIFEIENGHCSESAAKLRLISGTFVIANPIREQTRSNFGQTITFAHLVGEKTQNQHSQIRFSFIVR